MRFLDPKADLTFKRVFAEHPHLLIDLLNAILPIDFPILEIEYLPTELISDFPDQKLSIVDVRCVDQNGRKFVVEMQVAFVADLFQRMVYNAAKIVTKELSKAQRYDLLNPVYILCLLDTSFEKDTDIWFHHYSIEHKQLRDKTIPGMDWFFVELPKWRKHVKFDSKYRRDLWLTFLTDPEKLNSMYSQKEIEKFDELSEALELINASKYSDAQIRGIEHYLDKMRYNNTLLHGTRKDAFKDVLSVIQAIRRNDALEEIAQKYDLDFSYVERLKREIGGMVE